MKNRTYHSLKYILLAYMVLAVALPMIVLLCNIRPESAHRIFSSAQFFPMLKNSLVTTAWATVFAIALGFLLALMLHRSHIRFKGVFVVLFTVPMLVPSISHGTGLVLLFGDNGLITNLLGINIGIYGPTGIILGSVLYAFPVAFLMFHDSFQYEDFTVYEAANVLGIPKFRQFTKITVPYMLPTVISAILAIFTMIFTDYGVPLMTGGTTMTLPVYMYREVIGMTDFSGGAVISVVLLLPAFAGFILDFVKHGYCASSTVNKRYQASQNKLRDAVIFLCFLVVVGLLCLPVVSFVGLGFTKQYPIDFSFSLASVKKLLSAGVGMYIVNSVAIALLTALIGVCLAYFAAYVTSGQKTALPAKALHLLSMLPMAFPGLVLGLSFVLTFKNVPIYSTLFILVIVNIVHFFASPYLLACNALAKFNTNLSDAAQTLGISKMRLLTSVYIPCTLPTVVEMYSYFFVNAMMTISAVSFLYNFRTMPLSLLIPQLESQSFIEGTALVSLLILCINLLEKGIAFVIRRRMLTMEKAQSKTV